MKISICISTKNRKNLLIQTLEHIYYKQDLGISDFEVIITNDGDDDIEDLKNRFAFSNLQVIKNKHRRGLAGGRNNGAEYAKNDIILFLDDDILIPPDFLQKVIAVNVSYNNIILCGNRFYPANLIEIARQTPFGRYKLKHEYNWLEGVELLNFDTHLHEASCLAGFSASMRKETFNLVGGFNEQFEHAGCEDAEFFYRAKKLEIKLLFDESNVCYHNELDNFALKNWLNRQAAGIKSAVIICFLHPEGKLHPTWYTNTPIKLTDGAKVFLLKLKKSFFGIFFIEASLHFLIAILEKVKVSDRILFRLYNALWLAYTYKSFNEALKLHLKKF